MMAQDRTSTSKRMDVSIGGARNEPPACDVLCALSVVLALLRPLCQYEGCKSARCGRGCFSDPEAIGNSGGPRSWKRCIEASDPLRTITECCPLRKPRQFQPGSLLSVAYICGSLWSERSTFCFFPQVDPHSSLSQHLLSFCYCVARWPRTHLPPTFLLSPSIISMVLSLL
jgi:hypothetical protein